MEYIRELKTSDNNAFIIEDSNYFLLKDYKILESSGKDYFVKCKKVLFNGQIELVYFTKGLIPLSKIIVSITENNMLSVIVNILLNLIKIKENGFLKLSNILCDNKNIYVDPNSFKTFFIYMPISERLYDSEEEAEIDIRKKIYQDSVNVIKSVKIQNVLASFNNSFIALENLLEDIQEAMGDTKAKEAKCKKSNESVEDVVNSNVKKIVLYNETDKLKINVNKDTFVIGRSSECDYVLSTYIAIGRKHCEFLTFNDGVYIKDLDSTNGTFLNGKKLQPFTLYKIDNNDEIKLARLSLIALYEV